MHRSRLCSLIIDCNAEDLEAGASFWSQALGRRPRRTSEDPGDSKYIQLDTNPTELTIELQRVDHPSRVHLDIETDDIEAEVRRLEKLGAKRIEKIKTWWVMEAPSGHRFCVVTPQRPDFPGDANVWE
ncbi:MAG: VOC family protein [Acidiferrobacterales bacterium]